MPLVVARPAVISQPLVSAPARGSMLPGRATPTPAPARESGAPPASSAVEPELGGAAVEAVEAAAGQSPAWPDDAAESAFLAEARDRGEVVKPTRATEDAAEENADPKALPSLDELVNRIPAEVRDTLEDLFRAKFVKVQRVPKRVLKT